jgi:hypothetical protein
MFAGGGGYSSAQAARGTIEWGKKNAGMSGVFPK